MKGIPKHNKVGPTASKRHDSPLAIVNRQSPPPLLSTSPVPRIPPPSSAHHRNTPILAALALLSATSRTVGFHLDRRPYFTAGARALDQSGRRTEGGEDGLGVAAGVGVGVVFAHCFWLCLGFLGGGLLVGGGRRDNREKAYG